VANFFGAPNGAKCVHCNHDALVVDARSYGIPLCDEHAGGGKVIEVKTVQYIGHLSTVDPAGMLYRLCALVDKYGLDYGVKMPGDTARWRPTWRNGITAR
jgi:hypothetical protein